MSEDKNYAIWKELLAYKEEKTSDQGDDEYTLSDLMEMFNLTTWQTDRAVRRLLKAGKITRRKGRSKATGYFCWLYSTVLDT